MDYKIDEIEGIGAVYAEKLATAGIQTTGGLLEHCGSRQGRAKTAEATGVSEKLLLKWANLADMMRLKGVGRQYAELLEASGVDTVKELAQRRADNLAAKMEETNRVKNLANATPAEKIVAEWIDAAKTTEPRITH